jgi:hypothetical protein
MPPGLPSIPKSASSKEFKHNSAVDIASGRIRSHPVASPRRIDLHGGFSVMSARFMFARRAFAVMLLPCVAASAHAQWTVTSLHPENLTGSSWIEGGTRGTLVGRVEIDTIEQAALWNLSEGTFTHLHPADATYSAARAVDGTLQYGRVRYDFDVRAAIWSGDAASFIDLTPEFATGSEIYNAADGTQAGYTYSGTSFPHASLWQGTAASCIDINPAGALASIAYDTHGQVQAGTAVINGVQSAGTWAGTAESWQSLHPEGAHSSLILSIDGDPLTGEVRAFGGFVRPTESVHHAALWLATGEVIDLHDPAFANSQVIVASDGYQVGFMSDGTMSHAALWHGSLNTHLDLHAALSPDYTTSTATTVWVEDRTLYVAGYAYNEPLSRHEAVLWTQTLLCPSDFDHSGFVDGDDFAAFITVFENGDEIADFDHSGFVDGDDFSSFIAAFESGC